MPATANWRGLSNPFDPLEAIAQSAKLLRDLRREFGNLGLAAAAYNAGSGRVRDWLAGRRALPGETSAYVRIVTGYSPEHWAGASAGQSSASIRRANAISWTSEPSSFSMANFMILENGADILRREASTG
jgi:Transglycosylase SLT domain